MPFAALLILGGLALLFTVLAIVIHFQERKHPPVFNAQDRERVGYVLSTSQGRKLPVKDCQR